MLQRTSNPFPALTWWTGLRRRAISEDIYLFFSFLAVLTILCCAIYAYVRIASEIATTRAHIAELQAEYQRLERENAELVRQIGPYISISRIEERAKALGYGPPEERMLVRVQRIDNAVASVPVAAESASHLSWWQEVLDWASRQLYPRAPAYAQVKR
ncbi:MAG TPA: hypothetical protein G4O02_12615 [Caldilineae bacterium]|jgi:cell division protein FtsB|nr:hypothetical protein [Caldilineae bacterium]